MPRQFLDRTVRFVKASELARRVALLVGGSTVAQAIPIALSPILSRLYSPEDFGLLALFVGIVSIIGVSASARLELAVVLPERDRDAAQVTLLSILTALAVGSIFVVLALISSEPLARAIGNVKMAFWLPLAGATIFLLGAYQTLSFWLIRKKAFRGVTINKLACTTLTVIPNLALGFAGTKSGLIIGYVLGWVGGTIMALRQASATGLRFNGISWRDLKAKLGAYQDFPKYSAIPSICDGASTALPVIFFSSFFSMASAGHFGLARQVLGAPLSLISAAVTQVLFQHLVELKNKGVKTAPAMKRAALNMTLAGGVMAAILVATGPRLFAFVFGAKWETSGEFARILAIPYAIRFVSSAMSAVFPALDAVRTGSLWQILNFGAVLALIPFRKVAVDTFLITYAVIETILYSFYLFLAWRVVHRADSTITTLQANAEPSECPNKLCVQ